MDMTSTIPRVSRTWNTPAGAPTPVVWSGDLSIALTATGDVSSIHLGDLQISQYLIGRHDAGVSGLWLRHHRANGIAAVPLIGARSHAGYTVEDNRAVWSGEGLGVHWRVTLSVAPRPQEADGVWQWSVWIWPNEHSEYGEYREHSETDVRDGQWDIVSAQDLALAPTGQALSSEPYISQYVAFRTYRDTAMGAMLAARQTMACAPKLPLYVTAIAEGCAGYLTDGFDFYGRAARLGEDPAALRTADWSGQRINQYEFSMACLQSSPRKLHDHLVWHVISAVSSDYRDELETVCERYATTVMRTPESGAGDASTVAPHQAGDSTDPADQDVSTLVTAALLNGDDFDQQTFTNLGDGEVISPEGDASGQLLSFFSSRARHIVTRAKELMVNRSHGQILLSGGPVDPDRHVFAATTYAPGVFASHVVLGNTNMNRLVSVQHTSLNLLRSQGLRILVRFPDDAANGGRGEWRMLGVPSAYVMELGGSQWVYQLGERRIVVSTTAADDDDHIDVLFHSTGAVDVMATVDIESPSDWDIVDTFDQGSSGVVLAPAVGTTTHDFCPGLRYALASENATLTDDAVLFPRDHTSHGSGMLVFQAQSTQSMHLVLAARMGDGDALRGQVADALNHGGSTYDEQERRREATLTRQYEQICDYAGHLHVHGTNRLSEFNLLIPWFVQNALVHFLSPHGLEQYSGAAWGTRDVCQGPLESALAFGHYDVVRAIVLKVFAHQNTDGSLPQWFMFDEYAKLYQHDSHGDIPVWPLMAVAQYLDATGDWSVLEQRVGFWDPDTDRVCQSDSTVTDHLERTLDYIRTHRVPGTSLFSYGEGDWDDTLQPAQESMKKNMASTWTIALLYQASHALQGLLAHVQGARLVKLADAFGQEAETIRSVFSQDFIFDDVLAGYVSFPGGVPTPMIHPSDRRTGIRYRLIPMTRSIIAGLFDKDGLHRHESLIEQYLHYPDGVRLMSSPAAFHDGITTVFKRAEQSANVGREIGLMYTHAHIRYAEALGTLGRTSVGKELLRISPVGQFSRLANSEPRQRNCYYASSDADFPDRYAAAQQWDRLREGASNPVGVRGGWRVYSSGPGIYLRQVMQHVFGIQLHADHVVIDPVLEANDDGTVVDITIAGQLRHIHYHVVEGAAPVAVSADGRQLQGSTVPLAYRQGGLSLSNDEFGDAQDIAVSVGTIR